MQFDTLLPRRLGTAAKPPDHSQLVDRNGYKRSGNLVLETWQLACACLTMRAYHGRTGGNCLPEQDRACETALPECGPTTRNKLCLVRVCNPLDSRFGMNTGLSADAKQTKFGGRVIAFWGLAVGTAIIACAPFLLFAGDSNQRELPPNTLWEVVHNVCVPR